ncbi:Glyoxalase/Bleomycin resistance protein/Dihydroxybiphenyl dioxygenase [Cadophora sp. DSE1049]|nr:Glyoxalase/Bleomycin resistance protein/Dihydroxybiphenyl dioxygenase [Cadophora sp. DSE1049]
MSPDMLVPQAINDPNKVQLTRLTHVYFEHPDLNVFSEFAKAWGFVEAHRHDDTIYYRGYGIDQYVYVAKKSAAKAFKGAAFVAANQAEFDKAAKLPGAIVSDLKDAPGGGRLVSFTPGENVFFHVIYGQAEREKSKDVPTATHDFQGPYNFALDKERKGTFQRYHEGPAMVHKLGHYGMICEDFDSVVKWYTRNFNFVYSDILHAPDDEGTDILAFMRLDRGKEFVDHHVVFLARQERPGAGTYVHHTSYEIQDFDTQLLGHDWLLKKGYRSAWGVGRHILASQIFDYWKDTSGFKIEHYADGDVLNNTHKTGRGPAGAMSIWGPELPKDFMIDHSILDD